MRGLARELLGMLLCGFAASAGGAELSFEADVRPILKANCFLCHGEEAEVKGGLDVRLRRLILEGGDSGAAVVPGDAAASLLYRHVRDGEMPPGERKKLTGDEVALIGRWIDEGAVVVGEEPAEVATGFLLSDEDQAWWSFQPVVRPAVPEVADAGGRARTAIDRFVLRRLEAREMGFAKDAEKRALVRRLAFDLTGLPPTPDEIETFLADAGEGGVERLVDRTLASPHYGERWARHWLDVAGYADSEGANDRDVVREWAYRYRDYVVRSMNSGKPFDQFIREQLAGDEMVERVGGEYSGADIEKLEATGFLRMAADGTGADAGVVAKNEVVADSLEIVSSSLLGLTMDCARCHDHRYDPIPQSDYFRMRAIFEPAFGTASWKKPLARRVSLYTEADRKRAAEVEAEAAVVDGERTAKQAEFITEVVEKELAKLEEPLRTEVRAAREAAAGERSEAQKRLLEEHPSVNVSAGSLYLYNKAAADELKAMADKAGAIRGKKPKEEFVRALVEPPAGNVPVTRIFHRGDPEDPRGEAGPGGLTVLGERGAGEIALQRGGEKTTGRRLRYAERLTSGEHPLVARVIVNRVWAAFFGRGLVGTRGDFGMLGELPSHPELLDWLAAEFVESGWDLKALQRQIVLSTVYRQASAGSAEAERWYGRMPLRRLEAEALRDAIIEVSGNLNPKMFGPPVPVMEDGVGEIVVGKENKDGEGKLGKLIDLGEEVLRRSLYVQVRRSRPLGVLEPFDLPTMEPNCSERSSSTVAPQALTLMNSDFVVSFSELLAERVRREAGDETAAQVALAWELVYSRPPEGGEGEKAVTFLGEQAARFAERDGDEAGDVRLGALATLCQALLSSNEFLYLH